MNILFKRAAPEIGKWHEATEKMGIFRGMFLFIGNCSAVVLHGKL
jgi:hypothetical protein